MTRNSTRTAELDIGEAYTCRDGSTFVAAALTGRRGTYAVQGEDEHGRITWRSLKGRFTTHPHPLDAVRLLTISTKETS